MKIRRKFFSNKLFGIIDFIQFNTAFQVCCCCFSGENMISRVKSQVQTSKIDQANLENLKSV